MICQLKNNRQYYCYVGCGLPKWHYGEIPENYTEELTHSETMFIDLCNLVHHIPYKTFFNKRAYLQHDVFTHRIYADELKSVTVQHCYVETNITHYSLHSLCEMLTWKDYIDFCKDNDMSNYMIYYENIST